MMVVPWVPFLAYIAVKQSLVAMSSLQHFLLRRCFLWMSRPRNEQPVCGRELSTIKVQRSRTSTAAMSGRWLRQERLPGRGPASDRSLARFDAELEQFL